MIQIDMKMPKSCRTCPMKKVSYGPWCVLHDGVPAHVTDFNKRPDWCPLLPVNTEMPKKAEWTTKRTQEHDGEWYCSHCGYEPVVMWGENFCPNCGYKMTMPEPPKEET